MIKFENQTFVPDENESLLDCLLRHGIAVAYSCRNGICQTCLMRAIEGDPPASSQKGLKDSQISQRYFLACSCYPQAELEVVLPDSQNFRFQSRVLEKTFLSDSVLRLRISRPDNFNYYAGQYLTIFKSDTLGRSYSLASVPAVDPYLEFHIQVLPNGKVSQWLAHEIAVNEPVVISEPLGNCIYTGDAKNNPLLLIGTGTGLAPLMGIVRQAINENHQPEIRIYHGVRTNADLYLDKDLKSLAERHDNLHYFPCVTRELPTEPGARQGRANVLALEDNRALKDVSVYICGNPDMVNSTKRQIFLAGASLQNIHADPFLHS